jgi:hypothetical protein
MIDFGYLAERYEGIRDEMAKELKSSYVLLGSTVTDAKDTRGYRKCIKKLRDMRKLGRISR